MPSRLAVKPLSTVLLSSFTRYRFPADAVTLLSGEIYVRPDAKRATLLSGLRDGFDISLWDI